MKQVTAALIVKNNKILIAKRRASDKLANKWEFPGGKIEEGETSEQCLIREIKEEFQIEIVVEGYFGSSKYSYEHGAIELLGYWAKYNGEDILKPTVHDDYRWVSISELVNYDFSPADIPFVEKLKSMKL
ncbi:MAG: NUDIX hydrolase [Desulfitibacter sp. BRH_c19]|nr:MAG: NUDIX hydrolase [Desulfitibacter sp. BRH_c19]